MHIDDDQRRKELAGHDVGVRKEIGTKRESVANAKLSRWEELQLC